MNKFEVMYDCLGIVIRTTIEADNWIIINNFLRLYKEEKELQITFVAFNADKVISISLIEEE